MTKNNDIFKNSCENVSCENCPFHHTEIFCEYARNILSDDLILEQVLKFVNDNYEKDLKIIKESIEKEIENV